MNDQSLSLFHLTAPPRRVLTGKPPLLLLLHGFGADENDLFSLAPYLDERFLIISARAPLTLGAASYAWFNLGFTPQGITIDPEEIESSRRILRKFIDEVVSAYQCDPGAVYLMGFSQGGMMSLSVALTAPGVAAGVVSMSGRLMPQTVSQITDREALTALPIFVCHGLLDQVLPITHGRETRAMLMELPVDLTYHEYQMAHEISAATLRDVTGWLRNRLNSSPIILNAD